MTAGNSGASTPEDDDPFGYLYADGQRAGASSPRQGGYGYPGPAAQPGVPRTSYNQVRTVGQRQYGQQQTAQQYGQVPHQQQYGRQPGAPYAAPETHPGGAPPHQPPAPSGGGGGRGRGPNTRGLLIGAVAVVAVVVIGITVALVKGGDGTTETPQADGSSTAPAEEAGPSREPSEDDEEEPAGLPRQDAATLRLGAPAALAKDIAGAKGADGAYVVFNGVGGSASWTVDIPADGAYTLFITYSVPGKDAKTSLTINDAQPRSVNMSNFARAEDGDWEKGWTRTYAYVNLEEGSNTLKISCEQGDTCDALLDQVWLEAGQSKG
ncbi:carbohydrate-binding protein [Streptomyces pacificus]|uniref:Carbohydrate-binding protein n=1 Tax=Streptomyces pacificus TaxID=2705029 RepID=A0A6A0AV00_9ACTN|nr:carbohydrate-binding protein [Streptomyces pacificus]GFH36769.1 carbohydrate-binding protein [Streptomyces pacificus]